MNKLEPIIREMAANIFDMAVDVPMAQPVGTYYLHILLNMVPKDKAEKILESLPVITEKGMDAALDRFNAAHA